MSFESVRSYARAILQPLGLLSDDNHLVQQSNSSHFATLQNSTLWYSSTHTFLGSSNRTIPTSWPVSRFKEDSSRIPFDKTFEKSFDVEADKVEKLDEEAKFWLFERENGELGKKDDEIVPQPILVVKRYIPKTNKLNGPGLTLFILPGMGSVKEMFEPMLEVLLPKLASSNVVIDEIWSLDMPMSGETALANPPSYLYGNEKDITRDVLVFLTAYLPINVQHELPIRLPFRKPKPDGCQNTRKGLHVIAHSLGAQAAILSSIHAPNLFQSLSIFDPAIVPCGKIGKGFARLPNEVFCTNLPEFYQSRKHLEESIQTNKRTLGWDKRVQKKFIEKGIIQMEENKFRLTSPPRLEWALYYDKETPIQTFTRFQEIQIPINSIMPLKPFAIPSNQFQKMMESFSQKKNLVWISNCAHQIVHEKVDECAHHISQWLNHWSVDSTKAHL